MPTRSGLLIGIVVFLVGYAASGCGPTCKQVRQDFASARAAELAGPERDDSSDADGRTKDREAGAKHPHFALSVRTRFLERRADDLVAAAIEKFVGAARSLDVAGVQPVRVTARPEVRNLRLSRAQGDCDHCFRLRGSLDGELTTEIPVLGKQSIPMDGSFDFVAPVDVRPADDSGGEVVIDLGEAIRREAAPFALSLTALRKSWRQTIEGLLASRLGETLADQLDPVPIVRFRTPDFGIEGLGLQPTGIRISEESERMTALFTTAVPMARPPGVDALTAAAAPAPNRDLALAVPPRFASAAVAFGFRNDAVSRRYRTNGHAAADGPVRIALESFEVATDGSDRTGAPGGGRPGQSGTSGGETAGRDGRTLPWRFRFRAFHLPDSGSCYWFDGAAYGELSVADGGVVLSLGGVEFTNSSESDLAVKATNWVAAQFIETGTTIAEASLAAQNLQLPGDDVELDALKLRADKGFVTLSAVRSPAPDE